MMSRRLKPVFFSILTSSSLLVTANGFAAEKAAAGTEHVIKDSFETIEQIKEALRAERLESSDLIIGIDFTGSNNHQGKKTFHGQNLHTITKGKRNPYQAVIEIMSKTLDEFDDDGIYPAYIFGDAYTNEKTVRPLTETMPEEGYDGFESLAKAYEEAATNAINKALFSGPTTFAPMIRKAIEITKSKMEDGAYPYHILLILSDGEINHNKPDNLRAIKEASKYPISIITVGVGDGPWGTMDTFDDEVPGRNFDNFQFVDFHKTVLSMDDITQEDEDEFATAALQEIPEQYMKIKELGLMNAKVEREVAEEYYPKPKISNQYESRPANQHHQKIAPNKPKEEKKKKKKKFFGLFGKK